MPEMSPVAPRSGDVSFGICRACGDRVSLANSKAYVEDLERQLADAKKELESLRRELDEARLTVSAMDRRIGDLMKGKK